ncbi:MAG: hypothetical protein ABI183_07870 [Polyangiaceae bacterium]
MELSVLVDPVPDLHRLAEVLDELGHPARLDTIRKWDRALQIKLYEAADGFKKLTLEDYVPSDKAPLKEVIHHGKNSLPAFNHFQKRFCKPGDTSKTDTLYGYNHQSNAWATGPGYFAVKTADKEGEIDIDYRLIVPEKPAEWPEIIPNHDKLGRFVYEGMVDVMRGVSKHVSIGRAMKKGKNMDAWFVLCREE